jgi:hypothetical protein
VLANPDSGADGELFSSNLVNCPLRAVNGGRDPLYPAATVAPVIEMFQRGGVPVDFQVYPEAGHDVSWWPDERRALRGVSRGPQTRRPSRAAFMGDRADGSLQPFPLARHRSAGRTGSDRPLPDVNRFAAGNGREIALFARGRLSGRVDAIRSGNTFEIQTRGVGALTLLLSPDAVTSRALLCVNVNGRPVHDAKVEKSVRTLLAWAARTVTARCSMPRS